jgi:hypothetical protein
LKRLFLKNGNASMIQKSGEGMAIIRKNINGVVISLGNAKRLFIGLMDLLRSITV